MVRVEPVTLPWIEALVEGDDVFAELGYAVAPARRGRGIATEVVRTLVDDPDDGPVWRWERRTETAPPEAGPKLGGEDSNPE